MAGIRHILEQFEKDGGGIKKARDRWLFLALLGILMLVIAWPVGQKKDQRTTGNSDQQNNEDMESYVNLYTKNMESRLQAILEKIDGAGRVQVMLTVKNGGEQVVEKDRSASENQSGTNGDGTQQTTSRNITHSESTVYDSASGGSPYVIKKIEPEVEGVLVAAEGGDNEQVAGEITYAVQVLFDVPVHKIKVVKMSSR